MYRGERNRFMVQADDRQPPRRQSGYFAQLTAVAATAFDQMIDSNFCRPYSFPQSC